MAKYTYRGFIQYKRLYMQLSGMAAILVFNLVAILLLYDNVRNPIPVEPSVIFWDNPNVPICGLAIGFIFISWMIGGGFINFLPIVWIEERGIIISVFLLLKIRISWDSIINISPVDVGMGMIHTKYTLVVARKITLFHYLFGWLYSRTLKPGFLIHEDIDDYQYLIETIRRGKMKSRMSRVDTVGEFN